MNALLKLLPILLFATPMIAAAQAPEQQAPDPALPAKLEIPPPPESAPTVTIREVENGDIVEEYRQDGRLTSIRVRPLRGAAYTVHDANGDGRLDRKDAEGPVAPVYWTLYEWD